jgi:hypothetical protein
LLYTALHQRGSEGRRPQGEVADGVTQPIESLRVTDQPTVYVRIQ